MSAMVGLYRVTVAFRSGVRSLLLPEPFLHAGRSFPPLSGRRTGHSFPDVRARFLVLRT